MNPVSHEMVSCDISDNLIQSQYYWAHNLSRVTKSNACMWHAMIWGQVTIVGYATAAQLAWHMQNYGLFRQLRIIMEQQKFSRFQLCACKTFCSVRFWCPGNWPKSCPILASAWSAESDFIAIPLATAGGKMSLSYLKGNRRSMSAQRIYYLVPYDAMSVNREVRHRTSIP